MSIAWLHNSHKHFVLHCYYYSFSWLHEWCSSMLSFHEIVFRDWMRCWTIKTAQQSCSKCNISLLAKLLILKRNLTWSIPMLIENNTEISSLDPMGLVNTLWGLVQTPGGLVYTHASEGCCLHPRAFCLNLIFNSVHRFNRGGSG